MLMRVRFKDTPVELEGVTRTVQEWADLRQLPLSTVKSRRDRGSSWREALSPRRSPRELRRFTNGGHY